MPYIPDECFNLIKKFAGIHPSRYHHNKIAAMIENRLTCLREAWRCGKVIPHIPLVYEIIYLKKWCHDWQDGLDCVGDKDYHETRKTLDDRRFKLDYRLYMIDWNKTYRHLTQNHVWLKLTNKIESAYHQRVQGSSCEHLYVPELKQFCEENNIPQKLYSNLSRIGLISLIQPYNFEDS
jgi:hypothetical protein